MKVYAIVNYNYSNEEDFRADLGIFEDSDMETYPILSSGVFAKFHEACDEAVRLAESERYLCGSSDDKDTIETFFQIVDDHVPYVAIVYSIAGDGEIKVSVYAIHETEFHEQFGRWIEKPPYADETVKSLEFQIVCSRCDEQNSSITFDEDSVPIAKTFYLTRYCPNCGVKMDKSSVCDFPFTCEGLDQKKT